MITAVVLVPAMAAEADLGYTREIVVRSLVWLVSAVVASVVRDVVLAAPVGLGLSEVADQAGCMLVEADTEAKRLSGAVAASRERRVLLVRSGFQPGSGLVEELDVFLRHTSPEAAALILATPETLLQRLFPNQAPIVGLIATREAAAPSFARLARTSRHGQRLNARASRIV